MPKPNPYLWTECAVDRVIDGDTVSMHLVRHVPVNADLGFKLYVDTIPLRTTQNLRVLGINTPEIHGVSDKLPGLAAKAALERLLSLGKITVETVKPDKYGTRYDARITVTPELGEAFDVGAVLIETGFAKPFMVENR